MRAVFAARVVLDRVNLRILPQNPVGFAGLQLLLNFLRFFRDEVQKNKVFVSGIFRFCPMFQPCRSKVAMIRGEIPVIGRLLRSPEDLDFAVRPADIPAVTHGICKQTGDRQGFIYRTGNRAAFKPSVVRGVCIESGGCAGGGQIPGCGGV